MEAVRGEVGDLGQDGWGLPVDSFDATTARAMNFMVSGPSSETGDPSRPTSGSTTSTSSSEQASS